MGSRLRHWRLTAVAAATIAVAGCATPEQADEDLAGCREQARREARLSSWEFPGWGPGRRSAQWPASPFDDGFFEEVRLTRECMRAKGNLL